jgi:hypothetical protein
MATTWGVTPRQSLEAACRSIGRASVVAQCVAILNGVEADPQFLAVLAGPASRTVLDGREGGLSGYWPKVWAARGLLHVWDDDAVEAIIATTADPSWRAREMTAKVIARHRVRPAIDAVMVLLNDQHARVRGAAHRAFEAIADEE